jgi:hypothetical protein
MTASAPSFVYELNGKDIKLKPFGELPARISRVYRGKIEAQMWEAFEWGLINKKDLDVIDDCPMKDVVDMLNAWQEWDGVDQGKSTGSATSSTSTAKRSKPTSSTQGSD